MGQLFKAVTQSRITAVETNAQMTQDFERMWQARLLRSITHHADAEIREEILEGNEQLSDESHRVDVINWTDCALNKLEGLLPLQTAQDVLTDCACLYPHDALQPMRDAYVQGCDIHRIHAMLLESFRAFLGGTLDLEVDEIETILERGWGLAGLLEGSTILATKIPKSSNLREYLNENNPRICRELYCHCPRVRDAVRLGKLLSDTYCYCGAGFYKDIWETILGETVRVEVRSSVLQGDDVCTIAIHLPV